MNDENKDRQLKCPKCEGKVVVKSSAHKSSSTTCWHACEKCGPVDPIISEEEKEGDIQDILE